MSILNKPIGDYGESIAEAFLKQKGYYIIEKNFRCKTGEIDIIAKDGDYISFIEVKTRYSDRFGIPSEAITYNKQIKIFKSAQMYILRKKLYNTNFRFDVVQIVTNIKDDTHHIDLIKNAFQVSI